MPPSWVPISFCKGEADGSLIQEKEKKQHEGCRDWREVSMYKKQLTWQKIVCFAAVAVCALVFIYSLGLMTDLYDGLYYLMPGEEAYPEMDLIEGARIYFDMQPFNKQLNNYSIYFLLLACLLFITNTHNRRKYYIGNAVSCSVFIAAGVAFSVWGHTEITRYKTQFLTTVDFEAYKKLITDAKEKGSTMAAQYIDSTFWFDVHYVVFGLVLLVCLLLAVNYLWKMNLMKKEKDLLAQGRAVAE